MKADSLWYDVHLVGKRTAEVTLRRCLNCGEVKILSNPCGFDHLAALMEFRAYADQRAAPTERTWPENAWPTAVQFTAWFVGQDVDEQHRIAGRLLDDAETAHQCRILHPPTGGRDDHGSEAGV